MTDVESGSGMDVASGFNRTFLSLVLVGLTGLAASAQTPVQRPAAPSTTGPATITGRVIAADTGLPLRRASVRLTSPALSPRPPVVTDVEGRFIFDDIPLGQYGVTAQKEGFLALSYGQQRPTDLPRDLELRDGQTVATIEFSLPRASVIAGRVIDESGKPIVNAEVMARRQMFVPGSSMLAAATKDTTNDLGEFRLFGLNPGRYVVSASWHGPGATYSQDEHRFGLAPTYYPGTVQLADAALVEVGVGEIVGTLTFPLVPVRLATVEGQVLDPQGRPVSNVIVTIAPRVAGMVAGPAFNAHTDAEGAFLFGEVPPGDYDLRAMVPVLRTATSVATARVRTNGEDVRGIIVSPPAPATIAGRVVLDRAPGAPAIEPIGVSIGLAHVEVPVRTTSPPRPVDGEFDSRCRQSQD